MESEIAPCHVEIFFDSQQQCFCVRNMAAYLPLAINGMVLPNSEAKLHEGSTVRLGAVTIVVQNIILAAQYNTYHQQTYSDQQPAQNDYAHNHQLMVSSDNSQLFYYVPASRLVTMSILSCGIYDLYWMYRNYLYLKKRDGLKISALWRGILGFFFCHDIFKRIAGDRMLYLNRPVKFSPYLLSSFWRALYLLLILTSFRNDPFRILLVSLFSAPLSATCLVPLQNYINEANEKLRPGQVFSPWSIADAVCLAVGLFGWFLLVIDATGLV
jgi:hypothetical protein